jgi:hypothetical protein
VRMPTPEDSVDLLFTSPPYELARTYGIGEKMVGGQAWVDWMVAVVTAAAPKVRGLIAINCEGQTRGYRYSCVPFLLVADLHRAGFNLRKPAVFSRVGIPGSGGPDWLRNDWEPIVCVTRPGKLPWSDNTACGHPPKWAPGGEMAHRMSDGKRVNAFGVRRDGVRIGARRGLDDHKAATETPAHASKGTATRGSVNGDTVNGEYTPPAIANPGNILKFVVGGNLLGSPMAHESEAPFPLGLPAFFVKSFCPPGGIVCDCFVGSGTTAHAALENGRRFVGCDVRQSQVDLTIRRLRSGITPELFTA